MKKLKKIHLRDIDAMQDSEMKKILGGASTDCSGKSKSSCSGGVVPAVMMVDVDGHQRGVGALVQQLVLVH